MKIDQLMSINVVSVEMDDSLSVVKDIFDSSCFHHLLVIGGGRLRGVISDRDLLKAISPNIGTIAETARDAADLNKRAHQIMTRKPISLTLDADVYDAIKVFNNHSISCIPVVCDDNKPLGIISWRDILRLFEANKISLPQS